MSRASIERRLTAISAEINAARDELRVVDEQLQHFVDTADDARLRSMVSETPLAAREHRHASRTVANLQKDRDRWQERLERLESQQDTLLDQMIEERQ